MDETTETGAEPRTESDEPTRNKYSDLSDFRRDILHALAHVGPASGVAVLNHLGEYREGRIASGRFYPNINALVEAGLVSKDEGNGTNEYALTSEGKNTLAARRRWEMNGELVEGSA